MPQVDLYVDGACKGNPGPGGWGLVGFYDGKYGNNKTASSSASGKAYPLKEGAILEVEDGGKITSTSLAGTIYGDSNNITYTTDNIISNDNMERKADIIQ